MVKNEENKIKLQFSIFLITSMKREHMFSWLFSHQFFDFFGRTFIHIYLKLLPLTLRTTWCTDPNYKPLHTVDSILSWCKILWTWMSFVFISSAFAYFLCVITQNSVCSKYEVSAYAHAHTSTFVSSLLSSLRNWSWFMAIVVKVTHQCFLTMSTIRKNPFSLYVCECVFFHPLTWQKESGEFFPKHTYAHTHTPSNVTFSLPFVIINFYVRHIRRYIWPSIRW